QSDRVIELPGATIIPGFVDAHVHLTGTGVHHQAPEVASARSPQELIEILRKVVKDKDGPVLVHGYDESKWDRPERPTIDAHGVTCIHEMSMPKERGMRDLEILVRHRARLPLDVVPYVATTDVGRVLDLGLRRIGGDLPVDGSIGARTAWLFEPFADHEGSG